MHISARGNYGLRAVLDLALHLGEGHMQSAEIANRQQIPEAYLVQLLNQLRKAGVVRSTRGPKGGHVLLKRPEEVTVGEVLEILEGPIDLQNRGEREDARDDGDVLQEVWADVEDAIKGVLSAVTFGDLCRKYRMREGNFTFRI